MSDFDQLLRIREFRAQRAQGVVQAERAALDRATAAREQAADQLDEFKVFSAQRESALFADLLARAVQVRDIQDVRHEVGALRVQELGYEKALDGAEAQRVNQAQALEAARVKREAADRARQKIEERVVIDQREAACTRDRTEEVEMEEAGEGSERHPLGGEPGALHHE